MMNLTSLTINQKKLRRRILAISYIKKLSHLGSCFSVIDIIDGIYRIKKQNDRFILSNGHTGVAFYTVLEKHKLLKPSDTMNLFVHPDRNSKFSIDVSTGSLGQGLPIAIGMALANRKKNIYCVISDGECAEGSIWESFRICYEQKLNNLKIVLNANGWGAYDPIDPEMLYQRVRGFGLRLIRVNGHNPRQINRALTINNGDLPLLVFARTEVEQLPFLKGLDAHYYVMNESDYRLA